MMSITDIDRMTGVRNRMHKYRALAIELQDEIARVKSSAFDQHEAFIKTIGDLSDMLRAEKAEQKAAQYEAQR